MEESLYHFQTNLQALKQEIFSFKFIEPVGVDEENTIVEDVPKARANNQKTPSMFIRPGTGKQSIHNSWQGLGRYLLIMVMRILRYLKYSIVGLKF